MNLVFITTQPLHNNTHKKYEYGWYESRGVNVLIFDLSYIIFGKSKIDTLIKYNKIKLKNIIYFENLDDLEVEIINFSKKAVFFMMNKAISNRMELQKEILLLLNKKHCKYVIQDTINPRIYELYRDKNYQIKEYIKRVFGRYDELNKEFYPSIIFGSGKLTRKKFLRLFDNKTKYIDVKSLYVTSKKGVQISKHALFIESSVINSPDRILFSKTNSLNLEEYFNYINKIMTIIEDKCGIDIIISASGKYLYDKNPFGGRKIVYGKTLDMIETSKFVLCHYSICILQAIYDMKPILFINYKFPPEKKYNERINAFSKLIGMQVLKFPYRNQIIDYDSLYSLSEKSKIFYEKFIVDYIQESPESRDMKEALLTELKRFG